MNYEDVSVKIRGDVVKLFLEKYSNGPSSPKLQPTVNAVLEKQLTGKLVEINDEHLQSIKKIAEFFKCSNDAALNIALNSVEFELKETPKTRITLDRSEKVKAKKGKIPTGNPVLNY